LARLHARVQTAGWPDEDVRVWLALYQLGCDRARTQEAAASAGLVSRTADIAAGADAGYRRSTDATRATVGNMAPRR